MTHFRIEVKTLSKATGQASAAAFAYDNREKHPNKLDLAGVGRVNMPSWAREDQGKFWHAADTHERKNASLARRAILSFPNQLSPADRESVIKEWLEKNCPNMPASWAVHDSIESDPKNPHAHILVSERTMDGIDRSPELFFKRYNAADPGKGGCRKADIGSSRKEWLANARQSWADILNKHLPDDAQVDHRSLIDQGIFDHDPQPKIGAAVMAMEGKGKRTKLVSSIVEDARHHAQIRCLTFTDATTGKEVTFKTSIVHDDRINVVGKPTRAKCIDIVKAAQAKGWATVELTGTDEFKELMRTELRRAGIKIEGEQHEQNNRDHTSQNAGSKPAGSTTDGSARPDRTARPGNQHEQDRGQRGRQAGQDGGTGADHRYLAGTPEASAQTNLRATDISVAGRGRTADVSDFRNDIHSLAESADGMPTDKKSGGDTMQKDLTSVMVQKQLKSMAGVDTFEVGIRDSKTGKMRNFEMDRAGVMGSIARLKRENTKGADIYIRPLPKSSHPYIMLDDVGIGTIRQMELDGLLPVLEIETSQLNYQVLIRVPQNIGREDRKSVERVLQEKYKTDIGSADGGHYFRLAGFTNRKPARLLDSGKHPFCKVSESTPDAVMTDVVWQSIKQAADQRQSDELQEAPQALPLTRASVPGGVMSDTSVWKLGREQFQRATEKWGAQLDISRADYFISRNLLQAGAREDQVRRLLLDISPCLQDRKKGHVEDYVLNTVEKARQSLPELIERDRQIEATAMASIKSQERHDQAERQRRLDRADQEDRDRKESPHLHMRL
jgi:hypothetical protein